jgi:hypothetical protein
LIATRAADAVSGTSDERIESIARGGDQFVVVVPPSQFVGKHQAKQRWIPLSELNIAAA